MKFTTSTVKQEDIAGLLHKIFNPEANPNSDFSHIGNFLGDGQGYLHKGESEGKETADELIHKFFGALFRNDEIMKSNKIIVGLLYSSDKEVFLTDIASLNEALDKFDENTEVSWNIEQSDEADGIQIYVIVSETN